ncbi:MAG TPA: low molecular weight protein-tyrosine-phosphatase [Vicinamibacterales bacterium]|nr:low molecular weight protein-tyrosine-phosphatase [Vicinamibacterales bacterium]
MTKVLFVCMGNICRSPAAEGAFRDLVDKAGLSDEFMIDSAGTGAWHEGEPADRRMRQAAQRRGLTLTSLARPVRPDDYEHFDVILAMDTDNLRTLRKCAPASHHHKIRLFRDLDPEEPGLDVPDPYYGPDGGFEDVLDIVTRTSQALLDELRRAK